MSTNGEIVQLKKNISTKTKDDKILTEFSIKLTYPGY
jgi:hypothetical protein